MGCILFVKSLVILLVVLVFRRASKHALQCARLVVLWYIFHIECTCTLFLCACTCHAVLYSPMIVSQGLDLQHKLRWDEVYDAVTLDADVQNMDEGVPFCPEAHAGYAVCEIQYGQCFVCSMWGCGDVKRECCTENLYIHYGTQI